MRVARKKDRRVARKRDREEGEGVEEQIFSKLLDFSTSFKIFIENPPPASSLTG